ncbi:MAG: anthranilate synthase component 1, partial [Myxococcota bacterium]
MSGGAPASGRPLRSGEVFVLGRTLDAEIDPVGLYDRLTGRRPDTLLLETAAPEARETSRSLVMSRAALRLTIRSSTAVLNPLTPGGRNVLPRVAAWLEGRAQTSVRRADDGALVTSFGTRAGGEERDRLVAPSVLDAVRACLRGLARVGGDDAHPPMMIGSFAYDLIGSYEALPPASSDPLGWPDAELWLAEEVVWIEPKRRRAVALRYAFGGEEATYHDAVAGLGALVTVATEPAPIASGVVPPSAATEKGDADVVRVDLDDARYAAEVLRLKRHIAAGDVFQIVLSRRFSRPCPDALAAYARLRRVEPSPYMFFLHGARGVLFGASPESALAVDPRRRVTISPIAGTRRRGHVGGRLDVDLDGRIEAELRLDQKELAEHMMLVDLARNDVARVSVPGTRVVSRLMDVVRYSRVMHLVSEVQGMLRDELDALHAYVATMNMGTLVGAPKLEAASLLRRAEAERRGPYGGAVGYFDADGVLDTCIVIRSAVVRDGVGTVRAGAGVVHDSDPEAEADETRRKAAAVLSV